MQKAQKTSLKLPIFIMLAPIVAIIVAIFAYAVVNFVFSSYTSADTTSGTSLSDGASIAQGGGESTTPIGKTIANVLLFLLGAGGMLGLVPCLVIGGIMINRRRNAQQPAQPTTSRNWSDVE